MSPIHLGQQVSESLEFACTPARLWSSLATPQGLGRWLCQQVEGQVAGGQPVALRFDAATALQEWKVVECVEHERLVLEHTPASPPGSLTQTLEFILAPQGEATRLSVVHSGFAEGPRGAEWFEGAQSAWELRLALLQATLALPETLERTCFEARISASYTYDGLLDFFLQPEGLSQWLLTDGGVGMPGEPLAWTLRDGRTLSGSTLALTAREVAVQFVEPSLVLQMRAMIAIPGGRVVVLHGSLFGGQSASVSDWQRYCEAAMQRLKGALACAPLTSGVF